MFLKTVYLVAIVNCFIALGLSATDKVICYYSSWAIYRPGNGAFNPEDIDASVCTHVYYAFLGLGADGKIQIIDPNADVDRGGFQKVNDLKKKNPNLRTVISLGGANAGNAILSAISASPQLRKNLANSALEYFQKWGFGGLDIDWEYPVAADKQNYITLLEDLKNAFAPHGYELSAAVSAIPIDDSYDVPAMSRNLNYIHLMTYDFHVAAAGVTGQNSPLYAGNADNNWQKDYENVNSTVVNWIARGARADQLTIGLGFYGHTFTLGSSNHNVGAPANGPGTAGPYTKNPGTLGYNEICETLSNWNLEWDDQQKVPYKYSGNQWVGFDNPQSIGLKVQFAKVHNLAGVMIWTVDTDDSKGLCGTKNGLLQAIKQNL